MMKKVLLQMDGGNSQANSLLLHEMEMHGLTFRYKNIMHE